MILEFANKEDKSKEGSKTNSENKGNKENNSREGSRIDKENDSKDKND